MINWPPKGPGETANYYFDWSGVLAEGEAIASFEVEAEGVTIDGSAQVDDQLRVKLSGGALGSLGRVTATVVTDSTPAQTFVEVAVVPIGSAPISLAEAKAHLKVEDEADDALISALLAASVGAIEAATGRNLTPKLVSQQVRRFPVSGDGEIALFRLPAIEMVGVDYLDGDGIAASLEDYVLFDGDSAALAPAVGASWPDGSRAVVSYLAGYDAGECPAELVAAVKLLLTRMYQDRDGGEGWERGLPAAVQALIAPWRPIGIA